MKATPYFFEISDILTQFIAAFDSIHIKRFERKQAKETIRVRYVYGSKQRVLFDIVNKAQNITLPVAAIQISNISRDQSRVFNKINGFHIAAAGGGISNVGMPVPINIGVTATFITTFQEDMDQIISNFAPYNNPYVILSWPVPKEFQLAKINEIRSEVLWDGNISMEYPVDIDANQKARIAGTTSFLIKTWLFPAVPEKLEAPIFFIDNNFHNTNYWSANTYANIDDYSALENFTWTYPPSAGVLNEMETVSVSASPSITNAEIAFSTLYDDTIVQEGTTITLIGKRFQYTTAVYLSSTDDNLYKNFEYINDYTHFDSFSAFGLEGEFYDILSSNSMSITIPSLSSNSPFTLIVANSAGWEASQIQFMKNYA